MKYRCPKCGKEIEISKQELSALKNHIVCPQCLSTLKIDGDYAYIPLDFDEAAPAEAAKPAETEVTCPNCGKRLHGNPNFCPECGHNFNSAPAPKPANAPSKPSDTRTATAAITPPELPTQAQQRDVFYDDAVRYIGTCNAITTFMLQQYFNISYERAAQLMQQLEENGIVGPDNHGRPRKILIKHNQSLPFAIKRSLKFDPVMMAMEEVQGKNTSGNRGCGCWTIAIGLILLYFIAALIAG